MFHVVPREDKTFGRIMVEPKRNISFFTLANIMISVGLSPSGGEAHLSNMYSTHSFQYSNLQAIEGLIAILNATYWNQTRYFPSKIK